LNKNITSHVYQVKKKEAEKVIEPKNVEEKIEETKS
jgi:hypothetical protein